MKICPKCEAKHNFKGTFCSRKCANSRKFSEASKIKKSNSNKQYWNSLSDSEKLEKGKILSEYSPFNPKSYFETLMVQDWDVLGIQAKRLKVIIEQKGSCNRCKLTHWEDQRITLEYEHKDGNKHNNSRNNVEALCPNCHSLTSTWRDRKNKKSQKLVEKYLDISLS